MANLEDFNGIQIDLDFKKIIEDNCIELAHNLKQSSLQAFPKGSGEYANNWTYKMSEKDGKPMGVVYNKDTYMLSHLLEFGHTIANKYGSYGRWKGREHIRPVYEKQKKEYEREMKMTEYDIKIY